MIHCIQNLSTLFFLIILGVLFLTRNIKFSGQTAEAGALIILIVLVFLFGNIVSNLYECNLK